MSNLSYCYSQKIDIKDKKKLVDLYLSHDKSCWLIEIIDPRGKVDFEIWGEVRFFGYFDKEIYDFLENLAQCIEGTAEFIVKGNNDVRLIFRDSNVFLQEKEEWGKEYKLRS